MRDNVDPIPIPEETPQNRKIAWWLENSVIRSVKRIINDTNKQIRQIISFSVSDVLEAWENDLVSYAEPIFNEILATPNIPEYIKSPLRRALAKESQIGAFILLSMIPILVSVMRAGIGNPLSRIVEGRIDSILRSQKLDWGTILTLWQRNIITEPQMRTTLAVLGLTKPTIEALMLGTKRPFDELLLTQAHWRGTMGVAQINEELEKQGYTDSQIFQWYQARKVIPSPSDLVSMAVREAFSDSTAQQFGYDENYPAEAAEWAEKQGLGQEWFRRYWRAHWQLPGVTQVREMWRRGIIEPEDVEAYLLAADLPIFWRDAIQKWMSAEITRVDVRRLYNLNVIGIGDVYTRYRKLGYSEDDAELMTQWTSAEYMNDERELTKTDILTMYKDGIIFEEEATTYLEALEYRDYDITLLLAHQDLKREQEYEGRIIEIVQELFVRGIIGRTDVFTELGKLDTPGHFIEDSLQVWDLEKKRKIVTPSLTQLRDMALADVITRQEFRTELENKRYNDKYIRWYELLWFEED